MTGLWFPFRMVDTVPAWLRFKDFVIVNIIRSFLRNSVIFFTGSMLSRMVAFFMLPIYTTMIPPEDFGYYDLTLTYMNLGCEFIFMDVWVVVLRRLYDEDCNVGDLLRVSAVFTLIASSFFVLSATLINFFFGPRHLWYVVILGLVQAVNFVYKHICRGLGYNLDFALSGIFSAVLVAVVNLLFLVVFEWDFRSLYTAATLGFLLEICFIEYRVGIVSKVCGASDPREPLVSALKAFFCAALPIGLNAVTYWLVASVNRVVVSERLSLAANGVYATATRFGALAMLVITALNYAWQDQAFRRSRLESSFFSKASSYYVTAMLGGAGCLLPMIALVFPFAVGVRYVDAFHVVPYAVLVSTVSGFSNFLINIFYALKRNGETFFVTLIAGVSNMLIVIPLVDRFGPLGACLSTIIGYLSGIVFMLFRLRRLGGMRLRLSLTLPGVALLGLAYASYTLGGWKTNLGFAVLLLIMGVGLVVIFLRHGGGLRDN